MTVERDVSPYNESDAADEIAAGGADVPAGWYASRDQPEPQTKAGQKMWDRLAEPADYEWGNGIRDDILAIEQEAAALERRRTVDDVADYLTARRAKGPYGHQEALSILVDMRNAILDDLGDS